MTARSFAACAVALACALVADGVGAAEHPVAGKLALVKPGKLLSASLKGASSLPAATDPSHLWVYDTGSLGMAFAGFGLGQSGWKALGKPTRPKGFRYGGADPCTVLLKTKKIAIKCRASSVAPPIAGDLAILLDVGGERYCAAFGGRTTRNTAKGLKRRAAPAPSSCPDPCSICDVNATCTLADSGPSCTCKAGYGGDGRTCTPLDPCAACDPNATCTIEGSNATCTCKPGYEGDGYTCTEVAAELAGLRWELPCTGPADRPEVCSTTPDFSDTATMGGVTGAQYDVTLRFRGVVETKGYGGGTADGYWYVGGGPVGDGWNVYRIQISDPPQTYYLNAGSSGLFYCVAIDYVHTVRVATGAVVTMTASPIDGREIRNRDTNGTPFVIPGIPPDPEPYDGQFVQMDVVTVTLVP